MSELVEQARQLPPEVVGAIGALAAFLVVLASAVQLAAHRLQQELSGAQEELVDTATGLLPRSAVRVRLGAELAWALSSHTPLSIAVLRIRGSRFTHAAQVLRHSMREEEGAFLLGDQHVAVELWGTEHDAAVAATRRLGIDLAQAGHPVVDAGVASAPVDGSDVDTLLTVARRDLRPIEEARPAGGRATSPRLRGQLSHAALVLATALPAFVAVSALLLLAWRLVPAAVEPALGGDARSTRELALALVALLGMPIGAALLHATCWNLGRFRLPRSRPATQGDWHTGLAVTLVVAAPLAWAVHAPRVPEGATPALGATLAVLALVVLAVLHARQLVHAPIVGLVPVAAAGGALTWIAVAASEHPVVANAGRILLAVALGALLARLVERASWMLFLAVLAAFVDLWSVVADTGVSRQLLASDAAGAGRIVELLLFTGPAIGDAPPFAIGVTDLIFLAMFLAWSHDWRLDMRIVGGAMLAATWTAVAAAELLHDHVPMLPFLGGAMVLVLTVRSTVLRTRISAWRRLVGSDRQPPAPTA